MTKVLNKIKGYKTYIVCVLMLLVALIHLISGDITFMQFLSDEYVLQAAGFAGLRHGFSTTKTND